MDRTTSMTTSSSGWADSAPVVLWTALTRGLHRRCSQYQYTMVMKAIALAAVDEFVPGRHTFRMPTTNAPLFRIR